MTSKWSLGAKYLRSKVHMESVPHSWAVPTPLQGARCLSTAGAGSAACSLQQLVPGKPAALCLLCCLSWQPVSTSTLVLSLHGSCPIVPVLSGCPLCLFWLFGCVLGCTDGRVGALQTLLQTLPSTGPHHKFMQRLNDVFCFVLFFFYPFLVIPNILLAVLTPAQPWPVIFSKLATMLRSFSREVIADLKPLIMHV